MLRIVAPLYLDGGANSSWSSSRTEDGADDDPSKAASDLVHSSSQVPGIRTALIPICCAPDDPQPTRMRILWVELGGEDDGWRSKGSSSTMVELRWVLSKNREGKESSGRGRRRYERRGKEVGIELEYISYVCTPLHHCIYTTVI